MSNGNVSREGIQHSFLTAQDPQPQRVSAGSDSLCSSGCSNRKRPLAIDLFCGLGGWAEGFLAECWDVIGFDIERHDYGTGGYPGQLVLQDVLTLHGSQFRDAAVIVASPPCQFFSYTAMPWSRAKRLAEEVHRDAIRLEKELALFKACFRIAKEAGVPLIVENVRGAQPWVGRAKWNYGSFYLWGDVPALMPFTFGGHKLPGNNVPRMWADREVQRLADAGKKGVPHRTAGHWTNPAEHEIRGSNYLCVCGHFWSEHYPAGCSCGCQRRRPSKSSSSTSRRAASAQIAKIPFPLASHIARCFKPAFKEAVSI